MTTPDRSSCGATNSDDGSATAAACHSSSVACVTPPQFGSLLGRCRYIHFPDHIFEPSAFTAMAPTSAGLVRVFVGQTTYYATPRVLRYVRPRGAYCGGSSIVVVWIVAVNVSPPLRGP